LERFVLNVLPKIKMYVSGLNVRKEGQKTFCDLRCYGLMQLQMPTFMYYLNCVNPLKANDLQKRRAVSPLKIKITIKHMRK
jgi:hypothetical protein